LAVSAVVPEDDLVTEVQVELYVVALYGEVLEIGAIGAADENCSIGWVFRL
jgi:hypothetical protein